LASDAEAGGADIGGDWVDVDAGSAQAADDAAVAHASVARHARKRFISGSSELFLVALQGRRIDATNRGQPSMRSQA